MCFWIKPIRCSTFTPHPYPHANILVNPIRRTLDDGHIIDAARNPVDHQPVLRASTTSPGSRFNDPRGSISIPVNIAWRRAVCKAMVNGRESTTSRFNGE